MLAEYPTVAGIDEAGRGALAGPVVAAACILQTQEIHPLIRDSKQLTPDERDTAYAWILEHAVFGVGMVPAGTIDRIGILPSTERAMQQAVAALARRLAPTFLLVDGRDEFWFDVPHTSIIRGDESEPCISAASIVAKVTRDRLMVAAAVAYASYGFPQHKGYGTELHFAMIQKFGTCAMHRLTFLRNEPFTRSHVPRSQVARHHIQTCKPGTC